MSNQREGQLVRSKVCVWPNYLKVLAVLIGEKETLVMWPTMVQRKRGSEREGEDLKKSRIPDRAIGD